MALLSALVSGMKIWCSHLFPSSIILHQQLQSSFESSFIIDLSSSFGVVVASSCPSCFSFGPHSCLVLQTNKISLSLFLSNLRGHRNLSHTHVWFSVVCIMLHAIHPCPFLVFDGGEDDGNFGALEHARKIFLL